MTTDMAITEFCSENMDQFGPAFKLAQAQMGGAFKGADNPFFKSKYADLAEIIETCKEPLNNNGITFLQIIETPPPPAWDFPEALATMLGGVYEHLPQEDKAAFIGDVFGTRPKPRIGVKTVLLHESGQKLWSYAEFPCIKEDPQAYLAATTYLCRGSLRAILGIPTEDDDGEEASGRKADPDAYSKELTKDYPPNKWISGTFVNFKISKKPGDPDKTVIMVAGLAHEFIILDSKIKSQLQEPGSPITFKYNKRGSLRVIAEVKNMAIVESHPQATAAPAKLHAPRGGEYHKEPDLTDLTMEATSVNTDALDDNALDPAEDDVLGYFEPGVRVHGLVTKIVTKAGESAKGPWEKTALHIEPAIGDEVVCSTFAAIGYFGPELSTFEELNKKEVWFVATHGNEFPKNSGKFPLQLDEIGLAPIASEDMDYGIPIEI